jgi:hypothetical protein
MHRLGKRSRVGSGPMLERGHARGVLFAPVAALALVLSFLLLAPVAAAEQGDPDQAAKVSTDVSEALVTVAPGTYRLLIQNQSGVGSIDTFAWVPGPGWHVTSVVKTSQGRCVVVDAALACNGRIAAPTRCTCLPGGQMAVTFHMTGPPDPPRSKTQGVISVGTAGGYFTVKTVTLVNHHIPTELPLPND